MWRVTNISGLAEGGCLSVEGYDERGDEGFAAQDYTSSLSLYLAVRSSLSPKTDTFREFAGRRDGSSVFFSSLLLLQGRPLVRRRSLRRSVSLKSQARPGGGELSSRWEDNFVLLN